jgi:hypothetical protein
LGSAVFVGVAGLLLAFSIQHEQSYVPKDLSGPSPCFYDKEFIRDLKKS